MDNQVIDSLDENAPIKLTIPLVAMYLKKGFKQVEIAQQCNVSRQAVNQFITSNSDDLAPLKHHNDDLLASQSLHIANKAMFHIDKHLDKTTEKQLLALNAISGTHIDKYRLLSGQSTENTVNLSLVADVNSLLEQLKK